MVRPLRWTPDLTISPKCICVCFSGKTAEVLDWESRWHRLREEIFSFSGDIVCLQATKAHFPKLKVWTLAAFISVALDFVKHFRPKFLDLNFLASSFICKIFVK
jgi:hypothetical protein